MNKKSFTIKRCIDSDIKPGDVVLLTDGSGLSLDDDESEDNYYIVYDYAITNDHRLLKEIPAIVIQTNLTSHVLVVYNDFAYLQDIIVEVGAARFRTCSKFVGRIY